MKIIERSILLGPWYVGYTQTSLNLVNREPCSQAQTPRIRVCQAHFDKNHATFCRKYKQMRQSMIIVPDKTFFNTEVFKKANNKWIA